MTSALYAPIDVILTRAETEWARSVVLESRASAQLAQPHCYKGNPLALDLIETAAELALCKGLGIIWPAEIGTFKKPGAPHHIQIRTAPCKYRTIGPDFEALIIRPDDNLRDYYCLIVSRPPLFQIKGWMQGKETRQERWLREEACRPAAWFIPSRYLHKNFSMFWILW